ncbi:2-oxo acid dehydrogenase subunit E2 [Paenibacillus psychroresistens]|uniref:Dihydrolipoamide acetyltransferase component of pyruvate dehydrogenase complex n=1 Tax=Paenibacillus psychroresistens TaxID=1778678 RepID=A0A6B8RKL7_9BACL|nr:dihydrolipoamide acetyltransferase family protein [Paenibacillus psychroresistens]QGQ95966.1 2-oxo acid dehydrogenase subunit E2 [Paenibacillus psychroresistens]
MEGSKLKGTEVTVPHLAETLVSATVGKWMVKPGDYVREYDIICELLTEKVNVEMPSPIEGTILEILVQEGVTALVGEAICLIEEPANGLKQSGGNIPATASQAISGAIPPVITGDISLRGRFSPAVLNLATEQKVDLDQIAGTGLGGRITRKDVELYITRGGHSNSKPAAAPVVQESKSSIESPEKVISHLRSSGLHLSESINVPGGEVVSNNERKDEYYINLTPMRSAIARNMRQSVTEIPHGWMMIEVDMTNLVALRNKLKDDFNRNEGINLTYLAFLMKAVVNAIKDYPIMNSFWGVDKIVVKRDINISLAVGTEDSLTVPVIKKADEKNIAGLAKEIDLVTKKARSGKLTLADSEGGTFTINNTGSFGSILSHPIINYPQAAILTFESIVKRPVVIQDMIAVRSMVNLCLSLDHRILDGVICGRFLQRVKENLESFTLDTKLY